MSSNCRRTTILVVDDDEMVTRVLMRALTSAHFSVVAADSLATAREKLDGSVIDLAVVDVNLPDGSGFDLVEELHCHAVPSIILTVRRARGDVVRGLDLGAEDYVPKPFVPSELVGRIQAVLRRLRPPETPEQIRHRDLDALHLDGPSQGGCT